MEEDTVVQRHFRDGPCPTLVHPSSASQLCIMYEWGLMIYYCFRGMIWIRSKFSDSQKFARPRFHALIVFLTRWAPVFWKVATCQSTILFSASKLHMCSFFRTYEAWIITYFCSTAVSGFACKCYRKLRFVLWLFTSCVWDVMRYWILLITTAFDFLETWSSSFWNVCNRFDDFRTNLPKKIGLFHRKENTNFPKWRWVRSKNVFLSSALLFSSVVAKKVVFKTSWDLSTWNNTCFLFKCRVTFWLR